MRADDAMTLVLPEETSDDDDNSPMGDEDATPQLDAIDLSDDDDDEGHSEEQSIPLVGLRLGSLHNPTFVSILFSHSIIIYNTTPLKPSAIC
jgi:hypothetical protein